MTPLAFSGKTNILDLYRMIECGPNLDNTNIDLPLRQLAMKGVSDRIPLQSDPLAASQSLKHLQNRYY